MTVCLDKLESFKCGTMSKKLAVRGSLKMVVFGLKKVRYPGCKHQAASKDLNKSCN